MSNRRDFMGSGAAMAAAALPIAASGSHRQGQPTRQWGAARASLFVYQFENPESIAAGCVMAGQGVPVLGLDTADPRSFALELRRFWRQEPAKVVGLTGEPGLRQVTVLAAEFGFGLAHRAPAHCAGLVNWIVGPTAA